MMVMMTPFFHFVGGDYLLFQAWRPTSGGATAGACIGLFFFALFDRWVNAVSPVIQLHLRRRFFGFQSNSFLPCSCWGPAELCETCLSNCQEALVLVGLVQMPQKNHHQPRNWTRFRNAHFLLSRPQLMFPGGFCMPSRDYWDLASCCLSCKVITCWSTRMSLTLSFRTFNAGYIISILVGLGLGEILFGRISAVVPKHDHWNYCSIIKHVLLLSFFWTSILDFFLTLPWSENSENSTGYIGISEKWSSCQRVNGSTEWIMLALPQCGCQDTILISNGWKRLFDLVADWSNVILNDTEFTLAGHACGATFNLLCPMLLMLFDCSIIRGLPGVNDSVVAITHTHNLPCTKSCQNYNNRSVGLARTR